MFSRKRLRDYIREHGYKQKVISEKTGISENALSNILDGKRKCEVNEFFLICKAINATPDEFIEELD